MCLRYMLRAWCQGWLLSGLCRFCRVRVPGAVSSWVQSAARDVPRRCRNWNQSLPLARACSCQQFITMDTNATLTKKAEKGNALALSLDTAAEELKQAWLTTGNFARTIAYGMAVAKMRDALDKNVMTSLVKLKNSKMGYRTDEDAQKGHVYPIEVVRDCIIEAATLGLQCTGNQFNIIGGNMYVTKEGFTFLLRELARTGQLKNMKFLYHPAVITESSTQGTRRDGSQWQKVEREGKAKVDVCWEFNGVSGSEQLEFCIRVNAGMSQDAIIGKAERKAKAWLFNHLTDQAVSDGELEPVFAEPREVVAKVDEPSFLEPARPVEIQQVSPARVETDFVPVSVSGSSRVLDAGVVEDEIPGLNPVVDELPVFGEEC